MPTLRTLIDTQAPLRPAHAVAIALELLEALRVLHESGRAHGDVRPDLVELRGTKVRLLPPESVKRAVASDDVHAAGVVLYELLTRTRPDEDVAAVSSRTPASLPPRLDKAIARALDASPSARFTTTALFAQELRVCLVDALAAARRPLRPTHRF